jgi:penicillin-binding protein 1A
VGKTGTSNQMRDAWFAGFSTDLTCVVWTGYDDDMTLGENEVGAATSLPAFVSFMKAAHEGVATEFPVPPGIERASIDPKTGLLARPDQENALNEVFLEGTVPTETAQPPDEAPSPSTSPSDDPTKPKPVGPSAQR